MPASYPLINGVKYEYSSIEIKFNNDIFIGVKEINYSEKMEPSKVYGTASEPIGRTRGAYMAEGSCTVYKEEALTLRTALAGAGNNGYGEAIFDIVVTYSEGTQDPVSDELIGCRIVSWESSHAQGADALEEKLTLDLMLLRRNGVQMVASPLATRNA